MCDWPKSDCDVSVTDRQTNTLRFWPITFATRAPGLLIGKKDRVEITVS